MGASAEAGMVLAADAWAPVSFPDRDARLAAELVAVDFPSSKDMP